MDNKALDFPEINAKLEGAEPLEVLRWALAAFPCQVGMTTSFQNSGIVLIHMVRKIAFDFPIFFIDTGFHFPETLEFKARLTREWGLNIHTIMPHLSRTKLERERGPRLYERDPDLCCRLNKVAPLADLKKEIGLKNWISALRKDQSETRRDIAPVMSDGDGNLRIHPLAGWTRDRVWAYIRGNGLPYHPLYDQGYTSIGCFPPSCTSKNGLEGDERAGRWKGREKTECGLHEGIKKP
jgi:phosphoadenosine phosphosulfate reductase